MSISVIVRAHNQAAFIAEALESLRAQTRPPDEIVVVDDGSIDDTQSVVAAADVGEVPILMIRRAPHAAPRHRSTTGSRRRLVTSSWRWMPTTPAARTTWRHWRRRLPGEPTSPTRASDTSGSPRTESSPPRSTCGRWPERTSSASPRCSDAGSSMPSVASHRRMEEVGLEDWEFWVHATEVGMRAVPVPDCWLHYRRHPGGSRNRRGRLRGREGALAGVASSPDGGSAERPCCMVREESSAELVRYRPAGAADGPR